MIFCQKDSKSSDFIWLTVITWNSTKSCVLVKNEDGLELLGAFGWQ